MKLRVLEARRRRATRPLLLFRARLVALYQEPGTVPDIILLGHKIQRPCGAYHHIFRVLEHKERHLLKRRRIHAGLLPRRRHLLVELQHHAARDHGKDPFLQLVAAVHDILYFLRVYAHFFDEHGAGEPAGKVDPVDFLVVLPAKGDQAVPRRYRVIAKLVLHIRVHVGVQKRLSRRFRCGIPLPLHCPSDKPPGPPRPSQRPVASIPAKSFPFPLFELFFCFFELFDFLASIPYT